MTVTRRRAQLPWGVVLVTAAEAQVTQAGLWPEEEKPGREGSPEGGVAEASGRAQVTPARLPAAGPACSEASHGLSPLRTATDQAGSKSI